MTEQKLIYKARAGNEKAFRKLYELHVSLLFRFLKQFTSDDDLVKDWVQQAFIKAFRNINKFEGRSKFITWLFKIGINEMRNEFSRKQIFVDAIIEDLEITVNSQIEETFEWHSDMKWLLADLDDEKKTIFILFEVEGYKHSEIADILQISEEKSRTSLSRVKQLLRTKWEKEAKIND
ncbi:MAG: sigma-70 family RNA polymerase sigma factor [Bacteroidetes bacterium]|nr:sigma-70 family RNA polymerase sigma factor [Bacteroidota bacterium]